ncbi:hypothetical protein ACIPSA_07275 [Streptomyces sp. NPDC086549]|uniref:hypothetical protein n=1 Tax=Streptomyces sp. NPDC086549 TaxID=3365752 RepID=UPI00381B6964
MGLNSADLKLPEDGWGTALLNRTRPSVGKRWTDPAHLMRALRRGLRQVQYWPNLVDGCLTGTGLNSP